MQPTLERIDRDAEFLSGFWRAQLLDVPEQDHFAMQRIEIGERGREQVDTSFESKRIGRVDDVCEQLVFRKVECRRSAMLCEPAQTLAPYHREHPARDRRRGSSKRPDRARRSP